MARAIARACGRPGCRGIIRESVCSVCGPMKVAGWQGDRHRGTRQQRGYDNDWIRLRAAFVEEKRLEAMLAGVSMYPICELCGKPVEDKRQIHVDHIKPFEGRDDPLRLDKDNLRVTHERCHMKLTAGKGRGG